MEDQITRQLEEQLAITEDVIHIQSRTTEGRSAVDLSFRYGKDIDIALRDASTRLDRAKRFLPETIDPPTIFKRDPSQLPAAEYVVSSSLRDPVELRDWVDYTLGKWLLNLPGVAAAEVGGGLLREIQVVVDQDRLAGMGLDILDLQATIESENQDIAGGRLLMSGAEISGRTKGRFQDIQDLLDLPMETGAASRHPLRLGEIAQVIDGAEDERLMVRLNDLPGIKLSIQKQPQANTVAVVDAVNAQIDRLKADALIPDDIEVVRVNDEARFIRRSLDNATTAALSGAVLAMAVVYIFLGSLRRTLIIGSAIPIAVLVTIVLMSSAGLTLNTMTLGGLALGVGMLVDSTIVMLENIYRHQRLGESPVAASTGAAAEVNSAIVASTTTNLAAVLPFLFIGGMIGLLFRELIFTISASIIASLAVALTLVPALAGRIPAGNEGLMRRAINRFMSVMQNAYAWVLSHLLKVAWLAILIFVGLGAVIAVPFGLELAKPPKSLLPQMDDGRVSIRLTADRGINVVRMNEVTKQVEALVGAQPEVETLYTTVGGFIFGRSEYESPNRANIQVQLRAPENRGHQSRAWIKRMQQEVDKLQLVGMAVRMSVRGIRGLHLGQADDDLGIRVQGPDNEELEAIADRILAKLTGVPGLRNPEHSGEDVRQELSVKIDRQRALEFGLGVEEVGQAVRFALEGVKVTEFLTDDRSIDVVLRLNRKDVASPADLEHIVLFSRNEPRAAVRLADIAEVQILPVASQIRRDRQQRIVEVTASLTGEGSEAEVIGAALAAASSVELPPGYVIYEAGNLETLKAGRDLTTKLLAIAVFLVLVVMAVQYESLRNPLIITFGVGFSSIGVALGLDWTDTPISMPVWLGMIMLAGIVVNNAIVLVEYIEIEKARGAEKIAAIVAAARLRLRPILMTTLTTVVGMLPLAIALGEGAEMLQPLAITIISGLLFSTLVSLLLIPAIYRYAGQD